VRDETSSSLGRDTAFASMGDVKRARRDKEVEVGKNKTWAGFN